MPETDADKLLNLYEVDPTSYNLELRIKLETMKQLKRIADQLEKWDYEGLLDVRTEKGRYDR